MQGTRGTLKGVLIGGVIGAAAALLLAPKSGRELRGDIRDRYSDVQDRTNRILTDVRSKTQEAIKHAGQQASSILEKTRSEDSEDNRKVN
jgi:gas vesicle protein